MSKTVYLAGPIAHLTYDEATTWRVVADEWLRANGIHALSPMRGKAFLQTEMTIATHEYDVHPLSTDAGIVARDRADVKGSDLIIANLLGAPKVSVGTPVEYGWADAWRIPVITVMEAEDSPYDHPFIRRLSAFRVESLEEALDLAVVVLS